LEDVSPFGDIPIRKVSDIGLSSLCDAEATDRRYRIPLNLLGGLARTCADLEVYATPVVCGSVMTGQFHNGLDVIGLREEVEEMDLLDDVAGG